MPRIVALSTAVPPHSFLQRNLRELTHLHFSMKLEEIERLISVFDHVQVQRRFFSVPLQWFAQEHTFSEKNSEYIRWAEQLSVQAIEDCLAQAKINPEQIDHLLFVSTSGMATPSIDARLVNQLRLGAHVKRTPIFGLGCAGGAAGLSRCLDLARAYPGQRILLVSVELSSLTFQRNDFRKSNLVACALFADGAAAVLVCGDACPDEGIDIIDTQSTLFPNTLHLMGWEFGELGLSVVFSRRIPQMISRHIRGSIASLLKRNRILTKDLTHYIIHPGGARILDAFQDALQLKSDVLRHSRSVLRNYGNMSAPTVLFILARLLKEGSPKKGDYGLLAAFGPGFSSELLLLKW